MPPQGPPTPVQSSKLGGLRVQHLGPLDASTILVVVGRDNFRKRSAPIDELIFQLHRLGLPVCWYERKIIQHARLREQEFAGICSSWLNSFSARHPVAGYIARKAVRLHLKTKYPKRHGYFFKKIVLAPASTPSSLRSFIRMLSAENVFILAQSAGGITASSIASEEAIKKLVCFGYPFKHPDKPDEAYRTAHLPQLKKPFLIIQGRQDEYGSGQDALRYRPAPVVQIESVSSGHDYDELSEADFRQALAAVARFLELGRP